jgi:hypothetical protein
MKLKIDSNTKMTAVEWANHLKDTKPHLIKIEEEATQIQFGTIDIRIEVREGEVVKMDFWKGEHWLKPRT